MVACCLRHRRSASAEIVLYGGTLGDAAGWHGQLFICFNHGNTPTGRTSSSATTLGMAGPAGVAYLPAQRGDRHPGDPGAAGGGGVATGPRHRNALPGARNLRATVAFNRRRRGDRLGYDTGLTGHGHLRAPPGRHDDVLVAPDRFVAEFVCCRACCRRSSLPSAHLQRGVQQAGKIRRCPFGTGRPWQLRVILPPMPEGARFMSVSKD